MDGGDNQYTCTRFNSACAVRWSPERSMGRHVIFRTFWFLPRSLTHNWIHMQFFLVRTPYSGMEDAQVVKFEDNDG